MRAQLRPVETERQVGPRRIVRAGDHVRVSGVRGVWRVVGFVGDALLVYGQKTPLRAPASRTFTADRLGPPVSRADLAKYAIGRLHNS